MVNKLKFLKIKNAADGNSADLYVYGDIVDDRWKSSWDPDDPSVYPLDIKNMLDDVKGKDLTVHINSGGGDVFAGMAIANMLQNHDGKTTAVVDGLSASIATQIMFACDDVQIPENAYIMIHKPSSVVLGNADDMRKQADVLDTIQKGIESRYQQWAKDDVTSDQISDMVNTGTWLTGKDAANYFKIAPQEPLSAVACVGDYAERLKNRPQGLKIKDLVAEAQKAAEAKARQDAEAKRQAEEKQKENDEVSIALALASVF